MNRSVIQKVTDGRFDYPIISPEAMRNALREALAGKFNLPCNRERLNDEEQLAVKFRDYPDPENYADDFFFGYLVAATGADRKKIREELKAKRGDVTKTFQFKRDSVLRMNMAKALEPYRHNAVFTQSPLAAEGSAYKNASSSALLHRETAVTAFQFPFALNGNDCASKPEWTRILLKAVGELNDVAGNHARSYFEMAPASILIRLTDSLVAGYKTYCFKPGEKDLPDVVLDLLAGDFAGKQNEFYLGGEIVKRGLEPKDAAKLAELGVTLERDPRKLLEDVAAKFTGGQ